MLVFIFGTITDITKQKKEKKKNERKRKELEKENLKLQQTNSEKDKFFSIISHDLRSPFNALIGFSKILLKKHKMKSDKEREDLIEPVVRNAELSYKLVENLLTWTRTQNGKIEFSPKTYDLRGLFINIVNMTNDNAKQKNIDLSYTIDNAETIFADEQMLYSILRNLISNAIKFTHRNGKIILKVTENKQDTIISVSDNGIGISEEKQNIIFDISQMTRTAGTEKEFGTGLGLILCREFIEKYKGKIWLESKPGQGTTFTFSLPKNM